MQPLTFVHISDSHVMRDPTRRGWERGPSLPGARALVREIEALPAPVAFVLHTGDVNHDPEREDEYRQSLELYRQLSVPVYFLPGNHDRNVWLQRVLRGVEGPGPHADQELETGGVQFLLLDSSATDAGGNVGHGQLAPGQLAWLEQRCAAQDSRPLVVALHHHPLAIGVSWLDDLILLNGDALHEILLLARGRLRCVLYGHIHESLLTLRHGIPYQSVRGSWFQNRTWFGQETEFPEPLQWPGYNLVTLTEQDTFIRHCRVRL
ncbi:MAG: metallophosphoesterase [Anaerolineae bacterium]|nr:metallophosphoesterase [Anaerolineae bacterium]